MVQYGILHVHSTFSIHDSPQTPEEIVKQAKELGCKNITLTDHGTLLGIDDFMDAGKKYDINTIPGVEAFGDGAILNDDSEIDYTDDRFHLILLAKNYEGFQAISRVIRDANEHQVVRKTKGTNLVFPMVTKGILESLRGNENIIVTSACMQGPICIPLLKNFQSKKKRAKIEKKQKDVEKFYTQYEEAHEKYLHYKEEYSTCSKEITAFGKYTKSQYAQVLKNKKDQLAKKREKLESLKLNPKRKEQKVQELEDQIHKLAADIKSRMENISNASEVLEYNQKKLKEIAKQRDFFKKIVDETKSKHDRYKKYNDDLNGIKMYDDSALFEKAYSVASYLNDLFPNFFIELQNHKLEQEKLILPILVKIADMLNIPTIAANDAHIKDTSPDSITARQILRYNYFGRHQEVSDADKELYLKTGEELIEVLAEVISLEDARKAVTNTKVLEECNVVFPNEKHYPKCESEHSFIELLKMEREKMIKQGVWNKAYEDRLIHEIKVIQSMGYEDYHMVVRDFCIAGRNLGVVPKNELPFMPVDYEKALEWIKEKGFSVGVGIGPGRGSAAGSLVCYMLKITNIDPIKYNLLFERFLNPERVSMPDIDTDVKTSLRPYLIRYVRQKHGEKSVASISTVNTYAAKAAVQMAGRDRADELYGDLSTAEETKKKREYLLMVREISDSLPDLNADLTSFNSQFYEMFGNKPECVLVWERAKLIEGKVSGTGVHAGGVVISDNNNINEYVPLLWKEDKSVWATQCDMIRVEEKGMLKFDILGLKNLDCISDCVFLIKQNYGIDIDLDNLPFEKEVFENIYASGNTNSIFQVESKGMKNMMKEFQPSSIEDIILLISMYRPGPMQFIPNIIAVKQGKKKISYKTPLLESILSTTYGAISYQEQVMEIFQKLAGYSLGQADMVRRAMAKKKEEKLRIERNAFLYGDSERNIKGCLANGIDKNAANELFDEVLEFAKYAFNRSHAAAYAMVSYQTAWLKYHYAKEYLCAMFNNKTSEEYEPIIEDCMTYGIDILPPDINRSFYEFTTEGNGIRYGFSGIKGIADEQSVEKIIERRNGLYQNFQDFGNIFLENTNGKCVFLEKRIMDGLIKSGCFDQINKDRISLYDYYENMPTKNYEDAKNYFKKPIPKVISENENQIKRDWEVEFLKSFLRENPLKEYQNDAYYECDPIDELQNGEVNIFGYILHAEAKVSKNGNDLLIVNLQGKKGKINVLFTNGQCRHYKSQIYLYEGKVVQIQGSYRDGTIFGNNMTLLHSVKKPYHFVCDTKEKCIFLFEQLPLNEGKEELEIFTFFGGRDGHRLKTPTIAKKYVTKEFIRKIHAERI